MINNANKYSIAEIFNVDSRIKYVIPKFQREYTWNKDNWEELINDITESDGSHFIGSIICIKNPESDTYSPELELIDGQQRLTTISLLFCSMYKLLKEKMPTDNEDYSYHLTSLKGKIINRNGGDIKLELSRQNNNFNDYKSVLDEIGVKDFSDKPNNKGNRRIFKCFRYFLSKLEDRDYKEILELLDKISNTLLVKIEVDSHSDAFMLFESLNNRGIPLSAIDLIKNKILAKLEGDKLMTADAAFDKWNLIINNLPDYSIQERFLRQYYNAFKYNTDLVKVGGITRATKSNIIKIYENLIDLRPEYVFRELIEKSNTYRFLISPENNDEKFFPELRKELKDLINVKAAPAYILLLYLFSNEKYDAIFYKEVIVFLVKYFIRRNITDFPNTRNLDQIFIDLIEKIEEDGGVASAEFIIEWLSNKERMSSGELFEEKLRGDLYELNVDATRFILSKIEESKSTKEHFKDFWAKDNSNKLIWTIEHIFPEGKNIPADWVEMIADGNKEKAENIQVELVHKIGNLTLTGFNQNLSNFDFIVKRDRKNKDDNFIGYKNGLYLNEDLKDKETWLEKDIEERTNKLVSIALDIFKID
ncbi:MAG: DUF262 domain-containing HNH endonuclease family protein [Dysgonamonadaceae bacterium]|nr:DUF262 domain-containing HNH endonuclease family protein [Dysgonamonadaceae bacterium]